MIFRKRRVKISLAVTAVLLLAAAAYFAARYIMARTAASRVPEHESGEWFELAPDGLMTANGSSVTGRMRLGEERDKVLILFYGGGISIDEYTAAHPYTTTDFFNEDGFYAATAEGMIPDFCDDGIGSRREENPFRGWTQIVIPYTTADYHIGTTDYAYTDEDGSEQILHHHGYINYCAMMEEASRYLEGEPEELLIAGFSAGGFGAAMLAGDIVENWFPSAGHVTVCVDSAFQYYDEWKTVAEDVWGAPDELLSHMRSSNLVVDFLSDLKAEYDDRVTCLYIGSLRDGSLTKYQSYLNGMDFKAESDQGLLYMRDFGRMIRELQENVPDIGIYLFDFLPYSDQPEQRFLTQHTILVMEPFFWPMTDQVRPADWLMDAVSGTVSSHGTELYENDG